MRFNPCFLGMGAFTQGLSKVLSSSRSFNPCFLGMGAFTEIRHRTGWWRGRFQSLFSWNGRFHRSKQRYQLLASFKFQSLFSWNGRFHIERDNNWYWGCSVSILVFLEWALSQAAMAPVSETVKKFQSLFSWNGRFHLIHIRIRCR